MSCISKEKFYITPQMKEDIGELCPKIKSFYELGLEIGISETSLRFFYKGGGLSKKSYDKIVKTLNKYKKGEKMTDEKFNEKMKTLEAFLHNFHLMCDTTQREVLFDCLNKAVKDVEKGKMISFEKLLFELGE